MLVYRVSGFAALAVPSGLIVAASVLLLREPRFPYFCEYLMLVVTTHGLPCGVRVSGYSVHFWPINNGLFCWCYSQLMSTLFELRGEEKRES
jgi:hypothetical protein